MTGTLADGYSSESTQQEPSNEYQHDRVWMVFKNNLRPCALDESSLSIERVKYEWVNVLSFPEVVMYNLYAYLGVYKHMLLIFLGGF